MTAEVERRVLPFPERLIRRRIDDPRAGPNSLVLVAICVVDTHLQGVGPLGTELLSGLEIHHDHGIVTVEQLDPMVSDAETLLEAERAA